MIKAQQYRPQEQNRSDALERLKELILAAIKVEKARHPAKPTLGSVPVSSRTALLREMVPG